MFNYQAFYIRETEILPKDVSSIRGVCGVAKRYIIRLKNKATLRREYIAGKQ